MPPNLYAFVERSHNIVYPHVFVTIQHLDLILFKELACALPHLRRDVRRRFQIVGIPADMVWYFPVKDNTELGEPSLLGRSFFRC